MNALSEAQKQCRIVFMGTPEFAVASLSALIKTGYRVVAVITAPDKPAGRGMKLQESAVKQFAVKHNIPVLQPEKLKATAFLEALKALRADLQVVVAFRMLPEVVWNMPPMGTINVHASLLPNYRGAAPINWAIINGEKETGVTTFKLQHEIDTGNILLQKELPIEETDNVGDVHDSLMFLGADLLVKTVAGLVNNTITPEPQNADNAHLKHAPKIYTDTCNINWNAPVTDVFNLIRGLSPYPSAFSFLDGKKIKFFETSIEEAVPETQPGQYLTDGKTFLKFAASNGYIIAKDIQLEGKKRMHIVDFLRGYKFDKK